MRSGRVCRDGYQSGLSDHFMRYGKTPFSHRDGIANVFFASAPEYVRMMELASIPETGHITQSFGRRTTPIRLMARAICRYKL